MGFHSGRASKQGVKAMTTTIWLTGLPSAGKSTLAVALARRLLPARAVQILDGDRVRPDLFPELGFNERDRRENIRRTGRLALMLARHGVLVITPVIAPYRDARDEVRARHEEKGVRFVEVFVEASLATCVGRDVKGLYAKALRGEIGGMTGLDSVYESPEHPDLHLRTDQLTVPECVDELIGLVGAETKTTVPREFAWD